MPNALNLMDDDLHQDVSVPLADRSEMIESEISGITNTLVGRRYVGDIRPMLAQSLMVDGGRSLTKIT